MTASTLVAGAYGIDTAEQITPADTYASGGRFTIRYSAGQGNNLAITQFKLCRIGEIEQIIASGQDFVANSEWYTDRVTEGANAGRADALMDLEFWKRRGYAQGASIYCSWDTFPDPNKWGAVDDYLNSYRDAMNGYYLPDCYAGTPYLRHALGKGVIKYGWRPNAGSWSSGDGLPYQPTHQWIEANLARCQAETPAAIWQTGNYWFIVGADEDCLLRPNIGSHLQTLSPYIPPELPKDQPMFLFSDPIPGDDPSGAQYTTDTLRTVQHIDDVLSTWYKANGIKELPGNSVQLTDMINRINAERTSCGDAPYVRDPNGIWVPGARL